jgi:hypothetical protein
MSSYLRDTTLVSEKAVASHSDIQPLDLSPERVQSNANAIASAWECGFGIALDFFTWKESENLFMESLHHFNPQITFATFFKSATNFVISAWRASLSGAQQTSVSSETLSRHGTKIN